MKILISFLNKIKKNCEILIKFKILDLYSHNIFLAVLIIINLEIEKFKNNIEKFLFKSINLVALNNYFLVTPSPWPFLISISSMGVTFGLTDYMHTSHILTLNFGLISVILIMSLWFRDVIRESLFQGHHTLEVQKSLVIGMILFIVSEVMFFFSFFWAFFHSSLAPTIEIGGVWPPFGISFFKANGIPLLNTFILICSGLSLSSVHVYILIMFDFLIKQGFKITLILASLFTICQFYEYLKSSFNISDSIYGSIFFMATGFHGFHVIVGSIFILVNYIRYLYHQISNKHHKGFEFSAWYWHFVDVVWIFLFLLVYYFFNKLNFNIFF